MSVSEEMQRRKKELEKEEKIQSSLYSRALSFRRERFIQAENQLHFQTDQNLSDTLFIQEKVVEWLERAKDGTPQKKTLNEMASAIIRMNAYTITVESTAKAAVSETIKNDEILKRYESDLRAKDLEVLQLKNERESLKKEIELLKKQIDFGT